MDSAGISVSIAGEPCVVKLGSVTTTTLDCIVGQIPGGEHVVEVTDSHHGAAVGVKTITAAISISSITPVSGSLLGGTILTIAGAGFSNNGTLNSISLVGAGANDQDVACVPRMMINYACHPYTWTRCETESVYAYVNAGTRQFARQFDFSKFDLIECEVARTSDNAEYAAATVDVRVTAL